MLGDDVLGDRAFFLIFSVSALGPGEKFHVIETTSARDPDVSSWTRARD